MTAKFANDILKGSFINDNFVFRFEFHCRLSLRFHLTTGQDFVQVMAWRQTGAKPLPEPTLTQFIDAYLRHYGEMG